MIGPVRAVIMLAMSNIVLGQLAPVVPSSAFDAAGRMTLDGALILAVIVLWRALTKKDDQVIAMSQQTAQTMALVLEAVKELRGTIADLKVSYQDLPCAIRETSRR